MTDKQWDELLALYIAYNAYEVTDAEWEAFFARPEYRSVAESELFDTCECEGLWR